MSVSAPPGAVRNIEILSDDPDTVQAISNNLANDYSFKNIVAVNKRTKNQMTVRCKTAKDADILEQKIKTIYTDKIQLSTAKKYEPKIKIVGTPAELSDEILLRIIRENNDWIKSNISIIRRYQIDNGRSSYSNTIKSVDLETMKKLLKKGSIVFGLSELKVYEHVDVTQCFKCLRFGHMAKSCRSNIICRNCSEEHDSKECTQQQNLKCINCTINNSQGATFNSLHRATDERCPSRYWRVKGLMNFLAKK